MICAVMSIGWGACSGNTMGWRVPIVIVAYDADASCLACVAVGGGVVGMGLLGAGFTALFLVVRRGGMARFGQSLLVAT